MNNRRSNKRRRKTSLTKYYLSLYCKGSKKVVWGFTVRGSWRSNITAIFWPKTYGRHVVSFSFFWCSTGALGSTLLGAGFLYCILSASSLDPNSSGPQAPSAWRGFPYHTSSPPSPTVCNSTGRRTQLAWLMSWRSYIIVQRPLHRPRDLWNRMFNRHQAEITVMQFTGHSLPVRQSMRVSWEFFLPRPILSANFRPHNFLS